MRLQPDLCFSSVIVAVLFSLTSSAALGQSDYSHAGIIINGRTGAPLQAEVSAWASVNEMNPGRTPCPVFGDKPLGSVVASKEGTFKLSVPRTERTFTDTYCVYNFVPRVDTRLENVTQGTRIRPTPVELYERSFSGDDYQAAVVSKLNDLAYIRDVNPKEFQRVLETLGKSDDLYKYLHDLPAMLDVWAKPRPQQKPE